MIKLKNMKARFLNKNNNQMINKINLLMYKVNNKVNKQNQNSLKNNMNKCYKLYNKP